MNNIFRRLFKWTGIILGVSFGLLVVALAVLYYISEQQLNRTYQLSIETPQISVSDEALARGEHLVNDILLCKECHSGDLGGQVFDDGWVFGKLTVPNLTSGQGGIASEFSDVDWVRAIRHGIGPDGKPLVGMWSNYYNVLSDDDLAAVIAYIKSQPPVDNQLPPKRMGPLARLLVLQDPTILPARVINHQQPPGMTPTNGVNIEYGQYLTTFCAMCHGTDLSGNTLAGGGGNLTPAGNIGKWNYQEFTDTIRTGVTPEGIELDAELMPWKQLSNLTDEELSAIWLYLQTLPPVESQVTPTPQP